MDQLQIKSIAACLYKTDRKDNSLTFGSAPVVNDLLVLGANHSTSAVSSSTAKHTAREITLLIGWQEYDI